VNSLGRWVLLVVAGGAAVVYAALAVSVLPERPAAAPQLMTSAAVSMDQAVRMVEERYHARVVRAQTEHDDGHTLYVLRLLSDSGKVWTVRVDAASGSVL
jgi:uncharacterized membrane protein YkoI